MAKGCNGFKGLPCLGTGAQATVYREGNYALKVFKESAEKSQVFHEAYIHTLAERALQLPEIYVPRLEGAASANGFFVLEMECVEGKSMHQVIQDNPKEAPFWMEKLAQFQIVVQSQNVPLPDRLKDRLRGKLEKNDGLTQEERSGLLQLLSALPDGTELCHGDFHGGNLLTAGGRWAVIDWADATLGCGEADACRTYLIYWLHQRALADWFLSAYCDKKRKTRDEILRWMPVIGAARLTEGHQGEAKQIYDFLSAHGKEI